MFVADAARPSSAAQPRKPIPVDGIVYVVRFVEILLIAATGFATFFLLDARMAPQAFATYLNTIVLASIFGAVIFEWVGAYDTAVWLSPYEAFKRVLLGWTITVIALLVFGFAFQIPEVEYSRLWGGAWFFATAGALSVERVVALQQVRRLRRLGKLDARVVIYGAGAQGQQLARFITSSKNLTMRLLGFIDDRGERVPRIVDGLPVLGDLHELERLVREDCIDQVFLALPWQAEARVEEIVTRVARLPVQIRLAPDLVGFRYMRRSYSLLDGLPVLELFERPISGASFAVKAIEDQVLAALALAVLAPLIGLLALLIKLDSRGPVFYRQERVGFNHRIIRVWKFRTMYADKCDTADIRQARRGDPRVTPVGRYLRRFSLDELPQLFNVLSGEMSIVGPRPHAPSTRAAGRLFDEVVDSYAARHKVKPGITGWAQVNGWRGPTDTEGKLVKRVEHDLYYIENWSVSLDFYIILRTFVTLFTQSNAV